MKPTVWLLLPLLAASCWAQSLSYDAALEKRETAEVALSRCLEKGGVYLCRVERAAYYQASEAVHQAILDELRAGNARVQAAAASIREATAEIDRYVACRHHRHWWQAWKRRCVL